MAKIAYNGNIYNVIDTIKFNDTYHTIIMNNGEISFLNRFNEKYYEPVRILNSNSTNTRYLEFLRKQYILYCLIDYIKNNNLYSSAKIVIEHFKEYTKTSFVDLFLSWPYMDELEYKKRIKIMEIDLEAFLNQKLGNRKLASDNETIVIIDDYKAPRKELNEADFIVDPSGKIK